MPHEYRPYVQDGILEWNKAFEKVGFRDAIGVRWQNERDDFDPEEINYCTFRWITTPSTFAMSGLRANPLTGEIVSPIMAARLGFGLPTPLPGSLWNNPLQALLNKEQSMAGLQLVPSDVGPTQLLLNERLNPER